MRNGAQHSRGKTGRLEPTGGGGAWVRQDAAASMDLGRSKKLVQSSGEENAETENAVPIRQVWRRGV